jgi:hypothetical protein
MLYFLAWLYPDLIKAGELAGLTTLELALRDCYGNKVRGRGGRKPDFAGLLQYMRKDGLTDDRIPMVRRSGGTAIGFVTGKNKRWFARTGSGSDCICLSRADCPRATLELPERDSLGGYRPAH